ncbi:DUF1214 domain-containing protein [Natronorubrum thiooxidans]|uniref:DUF1214 domain-containing protein n=1 Tax=Natronorubrum thiooxidans TaxID=308853 RepID=A0A1N7GBR2_9EURY|nr:DUF1214 domain-containing protein [Natronorubrum thiooxidans]SIS10009.1 Protein of unknown function [Natronorubrum thiooxidans]
MSNETNHTTPESNSELLRATRRTALRGAGLAGLLALGGGSATASQNSSEGNTQGTENEMAAPDESVPVTWENFPRSQIHLMMENIVERGGFGEFHHFRTVVGPDVRIAALPNRDTIYSIGVFDLSEPVTITKPDAGDRHQSMVVMDEDAYVKEAYQDPGEYTLTRDGVGTRYVWVIVRTFVDPNDPDDVETVYGLQDELAVSQDSVGTFDIPDWDRQTHQELFDALVTVMKTMDDFSGAYGDVDEIDPVKYYLATVTPGGVPEPETIYLQRVPEQNDGNTPHTFTVQDVPVDGFWSVTVYNSDGFLEENEYDAYSFNNVTAESADDGTITIHFGGDPDQPNFLYTPAEWFYLVRLYGPREEILDGSYQFPEAEPIE